MLQAILIVISTPSFLYYHLDQRSNHITKIEIEKDKETFNKIR